MEKRRVSEGYANEWILVWRDDFNPTSPVMIYFNKAGEMVVGFRFKELI